MSSTGVSLGPLPVHASGSSTLFASPRKRAVLLGLALALGTLVLYQPVLKCSFTDFDDPEYITANIPVQNGLTAKSIHWAFTSTAVANWHPLTWLSHMADVEMFRLNPSGHHLSSVFLHSLNAVLLFLALWKLTGRMGRSAAVAALFAVHPLNVESVAWVSERKNLLCTFFWFLGMLAYWRYAQKPNGWRYGGVLVALALGVLSKPMIVTFPCTLLLLDYWPLGRLGKSTDSQPSSDATISLFGSGKFAVVLEKVPLFLLSAASSVITYAIQHSSPASYLARRLPTRLLLENALVSYTVYLRQLIWPCGLAAFYPHPINSLPVWKIVLAGAVLVVGTVLAWVGKRRGYPIVGWLWYLGTLVPVIGIVQVGVQAHADRYMYIPMVGLLVALVWGFSELTSRSSLHWVAPAALAVCVLAFSLVTIKQMSYWENSVTLFSRAVAVSPANNYLSHANLAFGLMEQGNYVESVQHYNYVLRFFPHDSYVRNGLTEALEKEGRHAEALEQANIALRDSQDPHLKGKIYLMRGMIRSQLEDVRGAEEDYSQALAISPELLAGHIDLGILYAKQARAADAERQFNEANAILPNSSAYFNLGKLMQDQNRLPEAFAAYQAALKLAPGDPDASRAALEVSSRMKGAAPVQ